MDESLILILVLNILMWGGFNFYLQVLEWLIFEKLICLWFCKVMCSICAVIDFQKLFLLMVMLVILHSAAKCYPTVEYN